MVVFYFLELYAIKHARVITCRSHNRSQGLQRGPGFLLYPFHTTWLYQVSVISHIYYLSLWVLLTFLCLVLSVVKYSTGSRDVKRFWEQRKHFGRLESERTGHAKPKEHEKWCLLSTGWIQLCLNGSAPRLLWILTYVYRHNTIF